MEIAFRQSLMRSGDSFMIFVEQPIALTLVVASCLLFLWNIYRAFKPSKASWEQVLG